MAQSRGVFLIGLLLTVVILSSARSMGYDDGFNNEDDATFESEAREAARESDESQASVQDSQPAEEQSGPQLPDTQLLQGTAPPAEPHNVSMDAHSAKEAAKVAKQAAVVANKVAAHSIKVTGHAKKALKHALGALHDARVESKGLKKSQKESLKKAEAHLREATKTAEYGKLKKVKDTQDLQKEDMQKRLSGKKGTSERDQMREEIEELRRTLKEKNISDADINKALDELEADLDSSKGPVNDESKAELERLRKLVDSLDNESTSSSSSDVANKQDEDTDPKSKRQKDAKKRRDLDTDADAIKPLEDPNEPMSAGPADETVTPVEEKGIDIDTVMPYGELEPFGREDTAQELTESSINESNEMVDQLERAEVAEEKRSVFRALTRLRGAAITSFDGVARAQTGNIDEYNKIHKWRNTHPLHHLADEESDVSKWAFPDNAD